ncbi:MAG: VCBS repeat-containing protein [Bryobacterales bacterium]|nr:VCBS repeat-containing protein [Bryobacterales bacterium]
MAPTNATPHPRPRTRQLGIHRHLRDAVRSLVPLALLASLSLPAFPQSTCPAFNYLGAAEATVFLSNRAGGLQRLADGSFTFHDFLKLSPYTKQNTTAAFQSNFYTCTGLPARTHVPIAGRPNITDVLLGTSSRNPIIADIAGDGVGTLAGVGLKTNKLSVGAINPNISLKTSVEYDTGKDPQTLLTADLNTDGRLDVVVVNYGDFNAAGGISVYLGAPGGVLGTGVQYTTGEFPAYATAGDFNGDNKPDLAVSNFGDDHVSVLINKGDGTFNAPVNYAGIVNPWSILTADLNKDGKRDIAVAANNGISILAGNGNGTFQAPTLIPTDITPTFIAAGDLNKDGNPDLAISSYFNASLTVMIGAGNLTFPTKHTYLSGTPPGDLFGNMFFMMDFDGDGNQDIVIAAGHPDGLTPAPYIRQIKVLFGKGDGTLIGAPAYAIPSGIRRLYTADFNKDGKPDLLANYSGGAAVLIGLGNGSMQQPLKIPVAGAFVNDAASGDFNNDGKLDIAVADTNNRVWIIPGNGDGTFQNPVARNIGARVSFLAAGDVNGDGKPDLIAGGSEPTSGSNSNLPTMFLAGNGDGTFQAAANINGATGANQALLADVSGDGKLDLVTTRYGEFNSTTNPGAVAVFTGNGNGTFQNAVSYSAGINPSSTLAADLNADGKLDLVATTTTTNFGFRLAILLNSGTGAFGAASLINTDFGPKEAVAADFNNDGKQDLMVSHCCGDTDVTFHIGNGNGTFQTEILVTAGDSPNGLVTADFNADGKPDLAVSSLSTSSNQVIAILNAVTVNGGGNSGVPITVTSVPTGRTATIDGNACTTPCTVNLAAGTQHAIAVTTTQAGAAGAQYLFTGWSDSGAASHTITVPASAITYTATFKTQYQLSIAASPTNGGTVTPATGGYYDAGTVVAVNATPSAGSTFTAWTGGVATPLSPSTTVTMDAVKSLTALFNGGTPITPGGLKFVPLNPCRVMETRSLYNFEGRTGAFGPPSLNAAEVRTLNLPQSNVCTIPATAKAYVVNVTLIPTSAVNFATLWPAGETRPNVWTIRSPDGQIVANSAIVKAGVNGGISVYASENTDLLIDISGYYTDSPAVAGLAYYPLTPCRVIETRSAYRSPAGPFGPPSMTARQTRSFRFPETPYCTVPQAAAYSVTITVVPPGPLAYLTAWPSGAAQPNVSNINSFAGRVLANSVIVPASANGSIDVFTFDATDFIIDINGYYAPDDGVNGLFYYPVTQCRANDSTVSGGQYPDESTRTVNIPAAAGCSGIPATAKGYALNVTALPAGNPMPFITAYPTGQAQPNASILNAFQGQIVTNSAIIPAGTNGAINIYAFRRTDVVVEVSGYFGR